MQIECDKTLWTNHASQKNNVFFFYDIKNNKKVEMKKTTELLTSNLGLRWVTQCYVNDKQTRGRRCT